MDATYYIQNEVYYGEFNYSWEFLETRGTFFFDDTRETHLNFQNLPKYFIVKTGSDLYLVCEATCHKIVESWGHCKTTVNIQAKEAFLLQITRSEGEEGKAYVDRQNEILEKICSGDEYMDNLSLNEVNFHSEYLSKWFGIANDHIYKEIISQEPRKYRISEILKTYETNQFSMTCSVICDRKYGSHGTREELKRYIDLELKLKNSANLKETGHYLYLAENYFSTIFYKNFYFDDVAYYFDDGVSLFKKKKSFLVEQGRRYFHYIEMGEIIDLLGPTLCSFYSFYKEDDFIIDILSSVRRQPAPLPFQMQQLLVCIENAYAMLPEECRHRINSIDKEAIKTFKEDFLKYFDGKTESLESWEVLRKRANNLISNLEEPSNKLKMIYLLYYLQMKLEDKKIDAFIAMRNNLSHKKKRQSNNYYADMSEKFRLLYYLLNTYILRKVGLEQDFLNRLLDKSYFHVMDWERGKPYCLYTVDDIRELVIAPSESSPSNAPEPGA